MKYTATIKKFVWTDSNRNELTLCVNLSNGKVWLHNQHKAPMSLSNIGFRTDSASNAQSRDTVFTAAMEAAYCATPWIARELLKEHLGLPFNVTQF